MPEELDGLDLWDLRPDDYMEVGGTWYRVQASLGVQWNVVPARPSAGREFFNSYLAELLTKDATQILSREQLIALGLSDLTDEHFIAVTSEGSTLYFKPDYEDDTDELAVDYHELCKILSRAPERVLALARDHMTSPDGDNLTYEKFETGLLPALSIHIEPSMSHKLFDALLPAGNFDAITLNALKVGLEAMREEARDRLVIDDLQLALSRNAPQLDTLFRDADEEGHIDKEQFAKAIQGVGLHVSKRYAKILYDHCDADRSGELEVDELRTTLDEMRGRLVQTRRLRAVGLKWVACAESPTTRSPKYGRDLTDDYLYRGLHDMLRGGKLELTFKQLDEFNLRNLHTNHIITVDEAHFCPQVVFGLEWLPVSTRPAHGEELTAEVFTKGPTARDMKRSATRRLSEANALLTGGSRRNSSHKALPVDNLRPGTRGLLVRSTTSVFARSRKESLRTNLERKVTSFEYEDLVQMGIQPGMLRADHYIKANVDGVETFYQPRGALGLRWEQIQPMGQELHVTGEPLKKLMHALSTGGYQEELRGRAQNDALSTLEAETLRELEDLQNAGRILLSMSQLESMGLSGLHANSFVAQSVDGTDFCRFWRPLPGIPDLRHDSFVEVAIDDDPRSRMYFKPETSLSSGRAPLLAGAKFDLMRMADTGEFKGLASQAGKRAFASLGFKSETASDEDDRSPSRRPHANKAATDPPPSPPPSPPAQSSASKSGKASGGNASKKEGPADLSMSDSRKEKAKKAASNYGFVSEDETATGDEVALVATANEKRRYAHKLWDEKQPLLGCTLQYVAGGGEVEIVEPVWPTYSMMPLLLKLDSYTLVHFGGPDTSGQERPIGDTLGSAGEEAVLGLVAHKWAMVELKAAQIRDDLAGETAGKVHLEAAKAEVQKMYANITKRMVLGHIIEDELAKMSYWKAERKNLAKRAMERDKRKVQMAYQYATQQYQLVQKDWTRFTEAKKASYLPLEARTNQPMPGDVLLKVEGIRLTVASREERIRHAERLLRDAGQDKGGGGLVVLTVRRQTEWKGIDVYYEVEVKVSKATDITFKEVHALLWAEASNVLACNAVLRRLDASTFTENDAAGKPHGEGQEVTLESLPSENTLMRLHTAKDRPFNGGKQSKHVRVFFSQEVAHGRSTSSHREVKVAGWWVDEKTIECLTPDFKAAGLGRGGEDTTVRVQTAKQHWLWCGELAWKWQDVSQVLDFRDTEATDHEVAGYLKTMTDPYDLFNGWWPIFYWEVVETLRKLIYLLIPWLEVADKESANYNEKILGAIVPLIFTVLCIMMYNNLKPYAQWQNDILQQVCQINIAFTLMVSIVLESVAAQQEIDRLRDSVQEFPSERMVEFVILFLFFLAAVCAVVLAVLETPAAKWDEVDKKQRRLFKVTRGMRRGFQRNVVFVDPHYSHAHKFKPMMLLSEEHGGVPYRGPDDPITVLEEERKKNVSLGAVMEGEETVLVKNQGRFQSIVISADAVQQGSACASRKGSSTRSSVRGRRGGSTGPTLLTNASVMGSSSLDHEAGLNCNWRAFPPCYPGAPFNAADAEEEMGASSFSLTRSSSREGAMTRRSVRGSVRSYGSLPLSPAGSRAGGYGSDPKEVFATSSLSDPQEGFAIELHHSVTQSLSQSDTEEDAAGVQDAPPSYGAHDMHADPLENTASTALRWLESTTQDAERADRAQGDGV